MDAPRHAPASRRRFSLLAGGSIASLLGLGLAAEGEAKRKHKKRRRKNRNRNRDRCLGEGQACVIAHPEDGGCCAGFTCGCYPDLCWVGDPGTCQPPREPA